MLCDRPSPGNPARERREWAAETLEKVGRTDRMHHKPTELPGGRMQRLAIPRAFVNRPPMVLADEPTGNLEAAA